ncbi:MAG: RluA family pseudouridine synthase [Cyanobacteria bacterium P01_C01_bin.121]
MVQPEHNNFRPSVLEVKTTTETLIGELSESSRLTEARILAIESRVLETLTQLKGQLIGLKQLPEEEQCQRIVQHYDRRLQQLAATHKENKQQRDRNRSFCRQQLQGHELAVALATITKASQRESTERRQLKQERERAIAPLAKVIAQTDSSIQALKQCYTKLSKQWQTQMQLAYAIPKTAEPLPIIYRDEGLIAVDKPAGLLSIPGRQFHLQDSVISRLRHQLPEQKLVRPVHRLDRDTSGVFAIALNPDVHRALNQQFATGQVCKTYEAILSNPIEQLQGSLELPLMADPVDPPKQVVDFQQGKLSCTDFTLLTSGNHPRVELRPRTGRTHQLRVHAAHEQGLNSPILGDILYNNKKNAEEERLYLHATALNFIHPVNHQPLQLRSRPPF